jgi:hypothetical protein
VARRRRPPVVRPDLTERGEAAGMRKLLWVLAATGVLVVGGLTALAADPRPAPDVGAHRHGAGMGHQLRS